MVRIVTIFILVFIKELRAESESNTEEETHLDVRSISTVDKVTLSLQSKEDAAFQQELLRASEELGGSGVRQPRLTGQRLTGQRLNSSFEFDFSKELRDYRRASLLSEATVLKRRVRSQAARRKRLENQSRKSHLERTKKTPKEEREEDHSVEKEVEDLMAARNERDGSHDDVEDEEGEGKHSNAS